MLSVSGLNEERINPLDTLELIVSQNEWPYERMGNEEIVAAISGDWCDFHLRYLWLDDQNILQCAGQMDVKVQDKKRADILELLTELNERLDVGHFSIWSDDNSIMFRYSLLPPTNSADMAAACELVTRTIIAEINRYFPVFQFVIWGGKSPAEAIEAAMLETVGNA
ncbi:YbjN domain-containing protein [Pseudemcibacter aquimaris]|uniref:YbjN domain-containing protein n=1 Tax=Pseudemcibacter aquimaris TaxID=2857064 RepID=UPI0020131E02|nr:YbjN domain-containing protein [Pseudemcibacter aquimaris]MCC3861007.1 YbjN domain-containing protein [Pseudemcibacter aquimaris]WDU59825.1 YbjN domain-containing protein [Pseudemcibacter aquimaris]